MRAKILLALFVVVFAATAFAFESGDVAMPAELNFFEEPKTLEITVDNYSSQDKALGVMFAVPTKLAFHFTEKPSAVSAEDRAKISILLEPTAYLANSSYYASVIVSLNNEKVIKQVKLNFYEKPAAKENPVQENFAEKTAGQLNELQKNSAGYAAFALNESEFSTFNRILLAIVILLLVIFIVRYYNKKHKEKIEKKTGKWRQ